MSHPPTSSGCPPNDVTASTIVSAPCSRAIRASAWIGFSTPVDVSACTIADDVDRACGERAAECVGIARAAPLDVEARHRGAVALAHLREPIAEVAGDDDQHARALAHEVGDDRFHARRAGAGDGERERAVGRPEQPPEPAAHLVERAPA